MSTTKVTMKPNTKPTTNWTIARRDLLKGLGVGAGLPAAAARRVRPGADRQPASGLLRPDLRGLPPVGLGAQDRAAGRADPAVLDRSTRGGQGRRDRAARPGQPELRRPQRRRWPRLVRQHLLGRGSSNGRVSYKQPQGKTRRPAGGHRPARPATAGGRCPWPCSSSLSPKASPEAGSSRCFWLGKGQPINPIGRSLRRLHGDVRRCTMVGAPDEQRARTIPTVKQPDGPAQEPARLRRHEPRRVQVTSGR